MRISEPPEYLEKSRHALRKVGDEICGPITESNAYSIGSGITRFFSSFDGNPQIDVGNFDRFASALGFVFARCAEMVSDGIWKLEWLCLSDEDETDGVYALINNNHSLLVYPIGIIRSDFLRNTKKSECFFEALSTGSLPTGTEGILEEYVL
jgi:hypothetical protein